jgi:hypothetical protein
VSKLREKSYPNDDLGALFSSSVVIFQKAKFWGKKIDEKLEKSLFVLI